MRLKLYRSFRTIFFEMGRFFQRWSVSIQSWKSKRIQSNIKTMILDSFGRDKAGLF